MKAERAAKRRQVFKRVNSEVSIAGRAYAAALMAYTRSGGAAMLIEKGDRLAGVCEQELRKAGLGGAVPPLTPRQIGLIRSKTRQSKVKTDQSRVSFT